MSRDLEIGFIGGGNMAGAIIAGLLRSGHAPRCLHVADPSDAQLAGLRSLHEDLSLGNDNDAVAAGAEVLILAVKPQLVRHVLEQLGPRRRNQLVVSVAAGLTLTTLGNWLGDSTPLVRVMPNQPALVGAGMAVMVAGAAVDDRQRAQADYVMSATGESGWVEDEGLIDAVTAVSGSGPAYFYLLMEILADWARANGIDDELAERLAVATARGAGLAAADSRLSPHALRASVTSPGGTTAAAITSLENAELRDIFRHALDAARRRSVELGRDAD
jgi:pyrroline-5-carboxylate reductase